MDVNNPPNKQDTPATRYTNSTPQITATAVNVCSELVTFAHIAPLLRIETHTEYHFRHALGSLFPARQVANSARLA